MRKQIINTREIMILKPVNVYSLLDLNSLYGWAMSEYLPYSEFQWLKMFDELDVMSISEKMKLDIFLKLILNILMNCTNYTMIIH